MAKYLVTRPSFISGSYRHASVQEPQVVTLADTDEPSRAFEPLDKGAQAALAKLGVKKAIAAKPPPPAAPPANPAGRPSDDADAT